MGPVYTKLARCVVRFCCTSLDQHYSFPIQSLSRSDESVQAVLSFLSAESTEQVDSSYLPSVCLFLALLQDTLGSNMCYPCGCSAGACEAAGKEIRMQTTGKKHFSDMKEKILDNTQ